MRRSNSWGQLLILLVIMSCGRGGDRSSKVHGLPFLDHDPVAYEFRQKFAQAREIKRQEIRFLKLDQLWNCAAVRGKAYEVGVHDITVKMSFRQGIVQLVSEEEIKPGLLFLFHPWEDPIPSMYKSNFIFSNRGLASSDVDRVSEKVNAQVGAKLKLTSNNDLIGEWSFDPESLIPRPSKNVKSYFHPSFQNKDYLALYYVYCPNLSSVSGVDPTLIGACRPSADITRFSSEEGGCYNYDTGRVFSSRANIDMPFSKDDNNYEASKNAIDYCAELEESGYSDWRLPSLDELLAVSGNNSTDNFAFNLNKRQEQQKGDEGAYFWSYYIGNRRSVWAVNLKNGDKKFASRHLYNGGVVCVRDPIDSDGDKVPDSSDQCPATQKSLEVDHIGDKKGCSAGQVPSQNSEGVSR